jgi:hypothetical protein
MDEAMSHSSGTGGSNRRVEKRRLASMVSVRLSPEEEKAVREAAARRGESVSNFIRQVIIAEVRPGAVAPLSAGTTASTTGTTGVTLEYVEGGKLISRSGPPTVQPA